LIIPAPVKFLSTLQEPGVGFPFTATLGFLFTVTLGFLFTIALGFQLTISIKSITVGIAPIFNILCMLKDFLFSSIRHY